MKDIEIQDVTFYQEAFVDRIKEQLKGRSLNSYSKEIGIPQKTLNDWVNKKRVPGMYSLILLSKKFDVSIDYLVGLKDY